ncbi:MAG: carboxymuconolactone decarboxylase family protein [Sphingomonadales bacterium]|nr:carboxymuconolactone decarboxylase family protein [Sphingomonadales bacterium]NCT05001.1 carboxymuconolactone decarboxylase family protein [Sphingomonadales bacterium]
MSQTYEIDLPLRSKNDTDEAVSQPLRDAESAMGMVPNMYAAMANLPALLATYSFGYDRFRNESGFTPVEQEIVYLTISRANSCHYCMAAHSMLADTASGVPTEATEAIREDRPISDERLEALREFTRTMLESRGNPTAAQSKKFLSAGYNDVQILAIVLAISTKAISNYSNHLFQTEVDDAFASHAWSEPKG